MTPVEYMLIVVVTVAVIGVVVCEVLLGFAMTKKDFRFTTGQIGRWTVGFFLILVVSVTALMALNR